MTYKTILAKTLRCRVPCGLRAAVMAASTLCEKKKTMKRARTFYGLLLIVTGIMSLPALGQITPSDDAYTLTSSPTKNFGTATTLEVQSSGATTFVRFDLSGIPSSVTGSMVAKGTLKIFVGTVATAGSFNVDLVTSSWSEKTITANDSPTLGSAIASAVPVTIADKDQYVLVDVTAAAVDWLNGTANDGIALVPDGTVSFALNSKETTTTSHPAELDIVLTGQQGPQGPPGPISGVTAGPGLTGGGTKGNVTVSMLTNCARGQILQWNGATWACSSAGAGTVTGVTAGTGLTGGGTGGNVTLNLDTTKVPQLATANTFAANQQINGTLIASGFNVSGNSIINVSDGQALQVTQSGPNGGSAIVGSAIANGSARNYGVVGNSVGTVAGSTGVLGWDQSTTGSGGFTIGVQGASSNTSNGIGVLGFDGTSLSGVFTGLTGDFGAGVWGDGGGVIEGFDGVGIVGTADNGYAGYFENNGTTVTLVAVADSGFPFLAINRGSGKGCNVDSGGNLNCTGTKNAVVPVDSGTRIVAMSAIEAPQNWFEDFGSAQLVNGVAVVTLDQDFMQTVNSETNYKVFPVPNGECKGLYVTNKTANSFEVRELGGGTSNIGFDYRITVLRKNYENVRFADHTHDLDGMKKMQERTKAGTGKSVHLPTRASQK